MPTNAPPITPLGQRAKDAVAELRAEYGNFVPLDTLLEISWLRGYSVGYERSTKILTDSIRAAQEKP